MCIVERGTERPVYASLEVDEGRQTQNAKSLDTK